MFKSLIKNTRGYKTIFIAICLGLITAAKYLGFIEEELASMLQGLLLSTSTVTIHSAVYNAKTKG